MTAPPLDRGSATRPAFREGRGSGQPTAYPLQMIWSLLFAVGLGLGAYWAAEKKGRSAALWLLVVTGTVLVSDYAARVTAQRLAGSNAIFTDSGSVAAIAMIAAGPLAGILAGAGFLAWLALRAPYRVSFSSRVRMHGGFGGTEPGETFVTLREDKLVLERGDERRTLETNAIDSARVDGEYLEIRVRNEPTPLLLRPIGEEHAERDKRIALVTSLARALVDRRSSADAAAREG
jgi:hypothetical protein